MTTYQRSLDSLTQLRRPLPLDRVVHIVEEAAAALDAMHADGRVHGELTPNSIVLDDLGHAHVLEEGGVLLDSSPRAYYAPERWHAQAIDGRADQYALAVIVYELLTGRRRLDAPVVGGVQTLAPIEVFADTPVHRGLALRVNAVLRRALSASAAARFPTVGAFARALANAAGLRPPARRRLMRLLPLIAGSILIVGLALVLDKTDAVARASRAWHERGPRVTAWVRHHTPPSPGASVPAVTDRALARMAAALGIRPRPSATPIAWGSIAVSVDSGLGLVFIDGVRRGMTPYMGPIVVGRHVISMQGSGVVYRPRRIETHVSRGETTRVTFFQTAFLPPTDPRCLPVR